MSEIHQKMIKCSAGHYYDANAYSACPYCSGAKTIGATDDPFAGNPGNMQPTIDPNMSVDYDPAFDHTIDPMANGFNHNGMSVTAPPSGRTAPINDGMTVTQQVVPNPGPHIPGTDTDLLPCVGWVVAIEGPNRGRDYRIHSGYNYLGRKTGDIVISGDDTISGERDASITYVYQTKKFYIAHENGRNVLLANNIPVVGGGTELHNFDIITIGNTKLIFIALCGENFNWEDKERGNG